MREPRGARPGQYNAPRYGDDLGKEKTRIMDKVFQKRPRSKSFSSPSVVNSLPSQSSPNLRSALRLLA